MRIVGVDPGQTGALALLTSEEGLQTITMPESGRELADLLSGWAPDHVFIEKVHAMPGQGVSSCFTFGTGYGRILGVVEALRLPHTLVTPQAWQKTTLAGMDRSEPKAAAAVRFTQLWPKVKLTCNKAQRAGAVDAALIAYHGTLTLRGG